MMMRRMTGGGTVSSMSSDAQIAREWAERVTEESDAYSFAQRAAARHILATTAPTMADVKWEDDVHAGLCALYADGDFVLMLSPDLDNEGVIFCHYINFGSAATGGLSAENLTPIPGTKIDLTPRREPKPEPESTPEPEQATTRPATLVTEDDYRSAPYGTVVWGNGPSSNMRSSLEKYGNAWLEAGDYGTFTPSHMAAAGPHQVLRWGEAS